MCVHLVVCRLKNAVAFLSPSAAPLTHAPPSSRMEGRGFVAEVAEMVAGYAGLPLHAELRACSNPLRSSVMDGAVSVGVRKGCAPAGLELETFETLYCEHKRPVAGREQTWTPCDRCFEVFQ